MHDMGWQFENSLDFKSLTKLNCILFEKMCFIRLFLSSSHRFSEQLKVLYKQNMFLKVQQQFYYLGYISIKNKPDTRKHLNRPYILLFPK